MVGAEGVVGRGASHRIVSGSVPPPKRSEERASRPRRSRQLLALLSLVAFVALAVEAILFVIRNPVAVVTCAAGLALALGGGWWVVSKRMPRRAVGIVGLAAGTVTVLATLAVTASNATWALLRLVITGALVVVATAAGRAALRADVDPPPPAEHRSRPRRPVLLCNPRSGGGKVERFGLVDLASSLGVETVVLEPGTDLEALARDALRRGADCLGMAGGDGSQALVAAIAVEQGLPFVCVPAGTRNHFALDLGFDRDDPRPSMAAFHDAVQRRVDYGTVNGRFFVNNVSLGVYATLVQRPEYRDAKSDTTSTLLPELLGSADTPFDLQFTGPDGAEIDDAFLVMVSNNPYVLGPSLDVSQRRRLDTGRLGIFAVRARTGAQAAEVVTLALAGQGGRSPHMPVFATDRFEVRSRSGTALAGIDGEAVELATPLEFQVHPQGLRLLVPEGNLAAAARRQARDVHVHDLVAVAQGSDPSSRRWSG